LWNGTTFGSQGFYYQQHGAVALETQSIPDSPNHPGFPDTILKPGEEYFSTTIYEFSTEEISDTHDNLKSKATSLMLVSGDTG
jgi:aldose 1-epimerase